MHFRTLKSISVISAALTLTACGGGGGGGAVPTVGTSISGTAEAPAGTVAQFGKRNVFEIASTFFISEAAAAITGLQPVTGASVELIRVDNNGNQVGEVLATTSTSITGDYSLTLPQGVNLAGNLVVRITGMGGKAMRAQVVEQDVDITPISEFVLQKYIEGGADLSNLVVNDVVKLHGQVEAFDLTAGADLTEMLQKLENEAGDFVDNTVAASIATAGNVSAIVGNYHNAAFALQLHDGDAELFGSVATDIWASNLTLTDAGNGQVSIALSGENSSYSMISGTEGGAWFYNDVSTDTGGEILVAPYSSDSNGILTVQGEFEERIDLYDTDCCGWRSPPATYRLQQVKNQGLYFMVSEEVEVRYYLIDTNGDSTPDAVDPNRRSGDEVFRGLEVFARKPSAISPSNISGDFGRVWMGVELGAAGPAISIQTESNVLTFNGNDTVNSGAVDKVQTLSRGAYAESALPLENNLAFTYSQDGDIATIAGSNVDGFVNDAFDFLSFVSAAGTDNGLTDMTLAVKLGSVAPTVTGNVYRVMLLDMTLSGTTIELNNTRFASTLTMSSESAGSVTIKTSDVSKADLGANVVVSNSDTITLNAVATIGAKGATTLSLSDSSGVESLEGFFNADGTLGVFRTQYQATGQSAPKALGLAVLVKIN